MPDLYEIKVVSEVNDEAVFFGLSSVDTGSMLRLFRMFNVQVAALPKDVSGNFVLNGLDNVLNGLDRVVYM